MKTLLAAALTLCPIVAAAQAPATTATAGAAYEATGLKLKLLGDGWRDVWTTPVRVPLFDLSRFAGGVTPYERGGGNQTISLRFRENGGWREHYFRSVNKDPVSQAMPPAVRGTPAGAVVQDLTSSLFPAAGLMVPPLLDAVGVLHVTPVLYVMPDDPKLGEFRKTFAGMLGTVELNPQETPDGQPGFANSSQIENADEFLDIVSKSRESLLDEREFFAARLVDFLINDNDRSLDNIRFARYGQAGAYRWRPLPRDRDRAFTDAGGWLVAFLIRPFYPKLIAFDSKYSLAGLTWESHNLDRRLLQRITRADADSIAMRVQRSLNDATIDRAIAQLPPAWQAESGDKLRTVLRARRDGLPSFANEFYAWLATDVDIHGTDEPERAAVTRHADGRVTVTISGRDTVSRAKPYFERTFLPEETREVRVFLGGGDDSAAVLGDADDDIVVRLIGEGGNDILVDSAGGGGTRFYDAKGDNEFITSRSTKVSLQEWDIPAQGEGTRADAPWRPDWGSSFGWGPTFGFGYGAGPIVGFGPRYTSNGFRRLPHKLKVEASALLALGNLRPGVRFGADYRGENSPLMLGLEARATKFEELRFHGYGNESPEIHRDLSRVRQDVVAVEPVLGWEIGWRTREKFGGLGEGKPLPGLLPITGRLMAGPVFYWSGMKSVPAESPLANPAVGGNGEYARAGLRFGLSLDRTSHTQPADRGWTFDGELAGFPPLLDVDASFGTAAAKLAAYLPLPGNGTHLAFRVGGDIASGDFPVQHSPAIGGRRTLRGFEFQRFRGESAAYGSAELRVPVGTLPLLVKWDSGVFALADAGRVWLAGESPGGWHSGFGGGVWVSSLGQTFSIAFAHGEQNRVYFQRGMSF